MKRDLMDYTWADEGSLPVRGRGLKLGYDFRPPSGWQSLPVRGRGLKLPVARYTAPEFSRSPCGGVD